MPSRSKKNQAERLKRKRFWADVEEAGALMGVDEYGFGHIDGKRWLDWEGRPD